MSRRWPIVDAQTSIGCSLALPAFCDTFNQPMGTGNRSGQLNGTVWGVSRALGQGVNLGQANYGVWRPATLTSPCSTSTVQPPYDVTICNGQVAEAVNDNQDVAVLAMYPKQPFDFAGRTGKITFDVSNDSAGNHSAWPELWLTDKPVPVPFTHEGSWQSNPQNGFGVRFAGSCPANSGCGACPGVSPNYRVGLDSAVIVTNYVANDSFMGGSTHVQFLDCVIASTGANNDQPLGHSGLNHYEVDVTANQIDVYGTDAGTIAPLRHLAVINGFGTLGLTRGLIWTLDVHYNADKGGPPAQGNHTFLWDNVGFDGPVLPRDLTFDVLDSLAPHGNGTVDLGYLVQNGPRTLTTLSVNGQGSASAAFILTNFACAPCPVSLTYALNGNAPQTQAWPYPPDNGSSWRTIAMPVPLAQVISGPNTITFSATQPIVVANVDLLLVAAGGVVPPPCNPCPTASPLPSPTTAPTATPIPSPTPSPSPTPTPAPTATPSPSPSSSPTPTPLPACQQVVRVSGVTEYIDQPTAYCSGAHP